MEMITVIVLKGIMAVSVNITIVEDTEMMNWKWYALTMVHVKVQTIVPVIVAFTEQHARLFTVLE